MTGSLRSTAFSGLVWGAGYTIASDVLQFATMIVLVRLLTPEIYGQAALAQTIIGGIAIFSVRTISDFALQARDPDAFDWGTHFSAGLLLNLFAFVVANVVSLAIHLLAPRNLGDVSLVISIMSLVFLLEPVALGYTTFLQSHHRWKPYRSLVLAGALVSAGGGIALALSNFGVIALAAMVPLQHLPAFIAYLVSDHPLRFRFIGRQDYREGKRFAATQVTTNAFNSGTAIAEQSLLSSLFGFASLGLFTRSMGLAQMTGGRVGPLVTHALYPVLTRAEVASERFRRFTGILLGGIAIVTIPAAAFLAVEAEQIVSLLYGERWIEVAQYLPLAAVIVATGGFNLVTGTLLVANLQQSATLKVSIYAGLSRLAVAFVTIPFGIAPFLAGLIFQGTTVLALLLFFGARGHALSPFAFVIATSKTCLSVILPTLLLFLLSTPQSGELEIGIALAWQGLLFGILYLVILRLLFPRFLAEFVAILPDRLNRPVGKVLLMGKQGDTPPLHRAEASQP